MSTICQQCGGQRTVYLKIEPAYGNNFTSAALAVSSTSMRICLCPESSTRHDGKLDERPQHDDHHAFVEIEENWSLCDGSKLVAITGGYGDCESNQIFLDSEQALSLLAWLEQEREALQQLARKDDGEQ